MNLPKLIEAVKKHNKIYKNSNVDEEEYAKEWQQVVKELVRQGECEVTVNEAQEKWNDILYDYMEYLRGNNDFALARNMDFLQPYLFTIIDDESELDEVQLSNILAEDDRVSINETALNNNQVDDSNIEKCPNVNVKQNENNSLQNVIQVEQNIVPVEQNITPVLVPPPAQQPAENTPVRNDSSFSNLTSMELIFLGYAKQLQKMPLTLQLRTKRKIADIMDEAELNMMEESMKNK